MSRSATARTGTKREPGQRRARRPRLLAAASVLVGFAIVSSTGATAAQAADVPAFEIFYGQNCSAGATASRIYTGVNSGEKWVDDSFNTTRFGVNGYGQRIKDNAASMYLSHARVIIYTDGPQSIGWEASGAARCVNFPDDIRNLNTQWATAAYSGQ
ncbi:hypothetical protein [Clavibacter sp. VKM Ac-2872]|uniref:hypothetical protein n=1 Tax=Clavibacter sp. VKM Ac-2872 TaxID=2783812 RepID=UPI00188C80B9|nr:hypothetical protein [Clavibacter sp. VKM Ac-2872]MBF4625409.1 hypothetical protein [Clavibacter sp. VKM Ac-2872]